MVCTKIYENGIQIDNTTIVASQGKWYKITLPTGLYFSSVFWVAGINEQEALDTLADFLEDNHMSNSYRTYDELWDEAEKYEVSFKLHEQRFICCGNHGIYLDSMTRINLLEEGEEII